MTLSGAIAFICFISPNSIALQACYVTVVEDRPTFSICSQNIVLYFWPQLAHPAARSLYEKTAIAELLVAFHFDVVRISWLVSAFEYTLNLCIILIYLIISYLISLSTSMKMNNPDYVYCLSP